MGMQININLELSVLMLLEDGLLNSPNSRLFVRGRVDIVPIEILSQGVQPEVPTVHPVWVEHGHHFEDKLVSEDLTLLTLFVREHAPDAVENEAGWSFTWMDSAGEKYRRLVKFVWSFVLLIRRRILRK